MPTIAELRCIFLRGGHLFGRWWWAERPEAAHRICEECFAMQKPETRRRWTLRARNSSIASQSR